MPSNVEHSADKSDARPNPWLLVATEEEANDGDASRELAEALGSAGYPVLRVTVPRGRYVEANRWVDVAARLYHSEVALFALTPAAQESASFFGALYWAERCAEVERESDGGTLTRVVPVVLDLQARKKEWMHGTYPAIGLPRGWRDQGAMGLKPLIQQLPGAPVEAEREKAMQAAEQAPAPLEEDERTSQMAAHFLGVALTMTTAGVLDEHEATDAEETEEGEPLVANVEEAFETARAYAEEAGDTALALRVRLEAVDFELLTNPHEPQRGREELHEIARDAAEAGLHRLEGQARFLLSELALDTEDVETIEAQLRAMYALAKRHGDTHMLARAQAGLGSYEALTGEGEAAVRYYREAAANLGACGDYTEQANQLLTLGTLLNSFEQDEEAAEVYAEALAIYESLGDLGGQASLHNNFGQTYRWQERYAEAHDSLQKALSLFEQVGETDSVLRVRHNIARTYIDQGEFEAAKELLEENRDVFERLGNDPVGLARTLRDLGLVLESMEESAEALACFERGLELLEAERTSAEAQAERRPWVYLSLGQLYAAREEYDQALEAFERAAQEAEDMGDAPVAAEAAFQLARLAVREAEMERAWHWLQKALLVVMEVSPDEVSFDVGELLDLARELGAPLSLMEEPSEDEDEEGDYDDYSDRRG